MTTISKMTLPELYNQVAEKGRVTPSVFARISELEDFSNPSSSYCESVCVNPCKNPSQGRNILQGQKNGILIVLDTPSRSFKDGRTVSAIIDFIMRRACPDIPYSVAYSVRCKPDFEYKKKYSLTQSKACFNFLKADILRLEPKVIVVTSTDSAKSVGLMKFGQKSNLSRFVFPSEQSDVSVLMTLNPAVTTMIRQNASGAFWGNDFYALIERDLAKAGALWRGDIGRQDPTAAVEMLKSQGRLNVTQSLGEVRAVCKFLLNLPADTVISWDTETTSLDPWEPDARFLSHQFGFSKDGVVHAITIPLWHRENRAYDPDEAWKYIVPVLEREDLKKVGHNGKFDLKYTRVTTGVEVRGYLFDTMYAVHSMCSGLQGAYSLKKAVWDFVPELGLGGYDDNLVFEKVEEPEEDTES